MLDAPATAALAVWVGAWLKGATSPDDLFDALAEIAPDTAAQVRADTAGRPLSHLLATLTAARADSAWLVLGRPGRPAPFRAAAGLQARPFILACAGRQPCALMGHDRHGWWLERVEVPGADGPGQPGADPMLALAAGALTPRGARRHLHELLADATERMRGLGLERAPAAIGTRRWGEAMAALPHSVDPEACSVLARAALVLDGLELALGEEGAAVTAGESAARRTAVRELSDDVLDLVMGVVNGQVVTVARAGAGPRAGTGVEVRRK